MASVQDPGSSAQAGVIFNLFGEEMVAIEVGTDDKVKRFLIHKQLLCDRMEYFNKMFNGQFKEGIEQKGSFPEDDIEAWGLMVEWVYRDISAAMPFASKISGEICHLEIADLVMDNIVAYFRDNGTFPGTVHLDVAYAYAESGSKLRLLMAKHCAYRLCFRDIEYEWDLSKTYEMTRQHPELAVDILPFIDRYAKDKFKYRVFNRDATPCEYHQHGSSVSCPYAQSANIKSHSGSNAEKSSPKTSE